MKPDLKLLLIQNQSEIRPPPLWCGSKHMGSQSSVCHIFGKVKVWVGANVGKDALWSITGGL